LTTLHLQCATRGRRKPWRVWLYNTHNAGRDVCLGEGDTATEALGAAITELRSRTRELETRLEETADAVLRRTSV
jgi:hypothetical protein